MENNKNKTPLLKALRAGKGNTGGTLYVFPAASEDIGLNINGGSSNISLSHYALLNIPPITIKQLLLKKDSQKPATSGTGTIKVLEDKPGAANTENNVVDNANGFGRALAMSLQNYLFNLDVAITNDPEYDFQDYATVSEQAFWHWLDRVDIFSRKKNLAAIATKGGIPNTGIDPNNDENNFHVYMESAYNRDGDRDKEDNTIIKCFGSIDGGNTVQNSFGMFNETYVNIPTSYGAGPVLFRDVANKKYTFERSANIEDKNRLEGALYGEHLSYIGYDTPFYDNTVNTSSASYNIDRCIEIIKEPQ